MNLKHYLRKRVEVRVAMALSLSASVIAVPLPTLAHTVERLDVTSSFTARLIGGGNVLVGAGAGREGTVWQARNLHIKEGTSDRSVLEFDLRGRSPAESVTLDFLLANLDAPSFTDIFLYSFDGNGLANAADYFRTDSLITTFTDSGLADGPSIFDLPEISLDVTSAYNDAIARDQDYLGLLLRNSTTATNGSFARYSISNGSSLWPLPVLSIAVPEPTSLITAALPILLAVSWRTQVRRFL